MTKPQVAALSVVSVIVVGIAAVLASQNFPHSDSVPVRPASVPQGAAWQSPRYKGIPAYGRWLNCNKGAKGIRCEIRKADGTVEYEGEFLTAGRTQQLVDGVLAVDGERSRGTYFGPEAVPLIRLQGGEVLLPAKYYDDAIRHLRLDEVEPLRPTVIAFFPPVTEQDLSEESDIGEALSDFQLYAQEARKPLEEMGIDFREIYAHSIRIRRGQLTSTFTPPLKNNVGYYLVSPGKKPLIKYGVMTNTDLLECAAGYFGIKKQHR